MLDIDLASIDGFSLMLAVIGIGLMVVLFAGLTAFLGAVIVVVLAMILRYALIRFDQWARGKRGSSKVGGASVDPSEIDWSKFE